MYWTGELFIINHQTMFTNLIPASTKNNRKLINVADQHEGAG